VATSYQVQSPADSGNPLRSLAARGANGLRGLQEARAAAHEREPRAPPGCGVVARARPACAPCTHSMLPAAAERGRGYRAPGQTHLLVRPAPAPASTRAACPHDAAELPRARWPGG